MRMHPVSRAMLGCGLVLLLSACLGIAQQHEKQPPLPEDLRYVPADAMGFIHFRAGDFLKTTFGKALLQELRQDRQASKNLKKIEQTLGIESTDLESVTLLMLTPPSHPQMNPWGGPKRMPSFNPKMPRGTGGFRDFEMKKPVIKLEDKFEKEKIDKERFEQNKREEKKSADQASPVIFQAGGLGQPFQIQREKGDLDHDMDGMEMLDYLADSGPLLILSATQPLDRKKILRAQLFGAAHGDVFDSPMGRDPSILFLSDRTVMMGDSWELARYSELMARKSGPKTKPMQSALEIAANPHLIVAGGHIPVEVRRAYFSLMIPDMRVLASVAPLFQTEAGVALDLGKSVDVTFQFAAPNEASAANALQAVKSLRVMAELCIEKGREHGESGGAKLELEKALTKALADATIEMKGTLVRAELKLQLGPLFFKRFTKDIVAAFQQRGDRSQSANNLKQIGLALHNYHDQARQFPPAGIGDRDGKPLLSWRVAILPYIEQGPLYKQFDLNQPWDHPTNKKLIAQMPAIYVVPVADTKEGMTNYRVLVGGGAMFEARRGVRIAEITDGTSNTFMVVEASEPTIWTRPDDLPYDPKAPLPKLGVTPDGFNVLMADGSVRFVRSTTPEDVLRAYITRAGGEVVPPID